MSGENISLIMPGENIPEENLSEISTASTAKKSTTEQRLIPKNVLPRRLNGKRKVIRGNQKPLNDEEKKFIREYLNKGDELYENRNKPANIAALNQINYSK